VKKDAESEEEMPDMVAEMVQKAKARDKRIRMKIDESGKMVPVDATSKKKRGEDDEGDLNYLDMLKSKTAGELGLRAEMDVDSEDDVDKHTKMIKKVLQMNDEKDT
jgi:hypothetical protein